MAAVSTTDTLRYPFHKPRGALVLLCASATRNTEGEWEGEPGQLQALADIRKQCIERGFTVIKELGTSGGKPTAEHIRQFVKELSEHDFSENDALMMVIGSHGHEGGIWAWPNPGEDKKSGPVALRDEIFSPFQSPLHGTGTKASQTLVGKPKLFLIDACRSPKGAEGTITCVEDPLRPAVGPEAKGVFDGLKARDDYNPPIAPDGTPVTRYSDFCFGYATVPFNEAGLTQGAKASHNRSLFLSSFAEQLRDRPHSPFEHQFKAANREMQRLNGGAGQVKLACFPQCAELVANTMLKALYFDAPLVEKPAESGMRHIMDVLDASERTCQDDPEGTAEVAAARRTLMLAFADLEDKQQKAKRARTRGGEDESSAFDTSALMASVMRIAQLVGGPNALTGPAGEAVQAACARLGEQVDGTVKGMLVPLRRELDALAQLPYDAPPQLTVTAPCEQQQQLSRGAVRADIAVEDDEDSRWTSIPAGAKLRLQMRCQQNGFCYLLHLNNEDQLSIIFPNKKNADNAVLVPGSDLHVQTRFKNVQHLERETFYLLTISKKLEEFEAVGTLPAFEMLQGRQAQAVLTTLRRVAGTAAATVRDLDAGVFALNGEGSDLTMALSTMTLISESATGA